MNKEDLRKNLKFFNVSEVSHIQSIYSKLPMRVFDVYANILKCLYSTRFSGPIVVTPLIRTMVTFHTDKYKKRKKECQEAKDKSVNKGGITRSRQGS